MTKKQLFEQLTEFPDNKEILVYVDDDRQTVSLEDFVAENTEDGNVILYLDEEI